MAPRRRRRRSGGGSLSRRSAIALIGGGAILAATGANAYSAASGERGWQLFGAEDEDAVFGMTFFDDPAPITVQSGESVPIGEFENRLSSGTLQVSIDVDAPSGMSVDIDEPFELQPGIPTDVEATVSCDQPGQPRTVELEIEATAPDASFDGTREVDIVCTGPFDRYDCSAIIDVPRSDCEYQESGDVDIHGEDRDGDLCIDGEGDDTDVTVSGGTEIDGFLRVIDAADIKYVVENNPTIDGAVNLYEASGKIEIEVHNNPTVEGNFCATGEDKIKFTARNNATFAENVRLGASGNIEIDLQGSPSIEGDLKLSSDNDVNVELVGNARIGGDLLIDAAGNVEVDVTGGATVEGEIDEDWDS